jgi:hypothetical protein
MRNSMHTYVTRSAQPAASRRAAFICCSSAAAGVDAKTGTSTTGSTTQETTAPDAETAEATGTEATKQPSNEANTQPSATVENAFFFLVLELELPPQFACVLQHFRNRGH